MNNFLKYFVAGFFLLCGFGIAQVTIEPAFPGLFFTRPLDLQHAGDGSDRIFVVEQRGTIWVFPNDSDITVKKLFLNITNKTSDIREEDGGLLGLAFHPDYENNGYFYVYYTSFDPWQNIVARYQVTAGDPDEADPDSEVILMEIPKQVAEHNAGQLAFGPQDGFLYIAVGDGGCCYDPLCSGQELSSLEGTVLRIDVDTIESGKNYGIPPDNPFLGNTSGYREETYAYGLRNPWRMSFDPPTGQLWTGDVGQDDWEEVNLIQKGGNYGWSVLEGTECFFGNCPPVGCDITDLTMPILAYNHNGGYASVTGGYVYRGTRAPELFGKYIYADFVLGKIWGLKYDGSSNVQNELLATMELLISAFGVDEQNELYIVDYQGRIYRFSSAMVENLPEQMVLEQNYPNPFNALTTIRFGMASDGNVKIQVFNGLGETVAVLLDDHRQAGFHTVTWDGTDNVGQKVASGIFYYELAAINSTLAGKMQLTR